MVFLHEALPYLATRDETSRNLAIGEPFRRVIPAEQFAPRVLLVRPTGDGVPVVLEEREDRKSFDLRIDGQSRPGAYEMKFGGLGEEAGGGYDEGLRQSIMTVGMRGIDAANAQRIEDLILSTLKRLADDGIDVGTVEASLNTFEFGLRERNTGSFPRGLALMLHALTYWLHGRDPLAPLAFEAPLARIKARVAARDPRRVPAYLGPVGHRERGAHAVTSATSRTTTAR